LDTEQKNSSEQGPFNFIYGLLHACADFGVLAGLYAVFMKKDKAIFFV